MKTVIPIKDLESTEKFLGDKKEVTVEELLEIIIDFLEFQGMDTEFYLPDPQDPTMLCIATNSNPGLQFCGNCMFCNE